MTVVYSNFYSKFIKEQVVTCEADLNLTICNSTHSNVYVLVPRFHQVCQKAHAKQKLFQEATHLINLLQWQVAHPFYQQINRTCNCNTSSLLLQVALQHYKNLKTER